MDETTFEEIGELGHFAASLATGSIAGAAGGALTALGAYSAAATFATASTGTAISTLSGAAASNATLAFFGGGSLATGGLGMAGGTAVLGGLVAGTALLVMGVKMCIRDSYNYVQVLQQAIVAAQEIYTGDEYVTVISNFADAILENTTTEEWSIRYFAAQVYLDLYARTDDQKYLQTAYDIAYDNVTILLDEQRALHSTYLADVVELTIEEPDYRFMTEDEKKEAEQEYKEEQKRLKEYNKGLKESRKTELPPMYEPLVRNCGLLFALSGEMNISSVEKQEIEAILQTDTNGVFLSIPVNDRYSFSATSNDATIEMYKDKIVIPASLLTANAQVVISVTDNGKTTTFDDCIVTKVERKGDTVDTFLATFSSEKMADYTWTSAAKVTVEIRHGEDNVLSYRFKVTEYSANWIFADKVVFEEE